MGASEGASIESSDYFDLTPKSLSAEGHMRWVEPNLVRLVARAEETTGKRFRARMVALAADLSSKIQNASPDRELVELFSSTIESIHLGSLVVDDIQDGSSSRREKSSLHVEFGVPLALNAGNWLYFSALKKLHALERDKTIERRAMGLTLSAMVEAHEGQAIDLGVDITSVSRRDVGKIVALVADKKTGALMEASFGLGALATSAAGSPRSEIILKSFCKFGRAWGVALQMLDDLGSFQKSLNSLVRSDKQFEDFRNRRPNFVWSLAMEHLCDKDEVIFRNFVEGCDDVDRLRHSGLWASFSSMIDRSRIYSAGFSRARKAVDLALRELCSLEDIVRHPSILNEIEQLKNISRDLEAAYGNFERNNENFSEIRHAEVTAP